MFANQKIQKGTSLCYKSFIANDQRSQFADGRRSRVYNFLFNCANSM